MSRQLELNVTLLYIFVSLFRAFEEAQQMTIEKALVLANQGSSFGRKEKKHIQGQLISEDLSQNVVAICGIVLPVRGQKQTEKVRAFHLQYIFIYTAYSLQ